MAPRRFQELALRTSYECRRAGKSILQRIAPTLGERLRRAYWKRRMRRVPEVLKRITESSGLAVRGGPFQGMLLEKVYSGSSFLPKLIGSYEDEVCEAIAFVIARNYKTIIDIGSAEGYYAVGFASRCRDTQVVAYDVNPAAREHLRALAELNGVSDRIQIQGVCSPELLEEAITDRTFILCDVEGAEREIMDPRRCPSLKQCAILIETHAHVHHDIVELLESRFQSTHHTRRYHCAAKHPVDYPDLQFLPRPLRQVALDEMRVPGQIWLWLKPLGE